MSQLFYSPVDRWLQDEKSSLQLTHLYFVLFWHRNSAGNRNTKSHTAHTHRYTHSGEPLILDIHLFPSFAGNHVLISNFCECVCERVRRRISQVRVTQFYSAAEEFAGRHNRHNILIHGVHVLVYIAAMMKQWDIYVQTINHTTDNSIRQNSSDQSWKKRKTGIGKYGNAHAGNQLRDNQTCTRNCY